MSFDSWKTTNPADNELGRTNGQPVPYRCTACGWTGKGSIARRDHWQATRHTVVPASEPRCDDAATSGRRSA